jgi:uncharacterized protein (TIGR03437 family)
MVKHFELFNWKRYACVLSIGLLAAGGGHAQIAASAYRVLGQANLTNNGLNQVQGVELNGPGGIALDLRGGQVHLYIADTGNARVLAWRDVNSYQLGDAPALVLGQSGLQSSGAFGIGAKGFNAPVSLAVDPTTGNLFVADGSANRVVRFPSPFDNPTRIEPDAVYGQANFTTFTAGTTASSMRQPRAVAVDASGNLWVVDTGNNRVLRFNAASLGTPAPVNADLVIGQKDLQSGAANLGGAVSASGFDAPGGLAFDGQGNLYVSDFNNARVIRFPAPLVPGSIPPAANAVWGQASLTTRVIAAQATASSIGGAQGISVDAGGNLYVAVPRDNRVLVFPTSATAGTNATNVLGQSDFTTTTANTRTFPQASASTLSSPVDVKVDSNGNVFLSDSLNHRVLRIPGGAKSANQVWGQSGFTTNGPNQTKASSVAYAYQMAIDYSQAPFALYVSDTANNRVLIWKDSVKFRSGDPADAVIGQPTLQSAYPNADGGVAQTPASTSLASPTGIVVDAAGTLYVADSGNNRILRFPRPVAQSGRITPDAVIGQLNFTTATSAAVSASSLNAPASLAIGPNGDLFVADSGNNRVLEFPAGAGNGALAIRVFGQAGFNSSSRPSQLGTQTLAAPQGLYIDQASNLYVADTGANRVLIFSNTQVAPPVGAAATYVIGHGNFSGGSGGTSMKAPVGIGVDGNGQIYVADTGNNRVLMFPSLILLPVGGGVATGVVGQPNLSSTAANWDGQNGLSSADALSAPAGIYLDRQGTLYVGDTGNSRALQFLKLAGVVNGATFQTAIPIAPGSIATIGGNGLAGATGQAAGTTWPSTIVNRQVVLNDQLLAPLYFVGLNQINFQIPSGAPLGSNRLAVRLADTGELVAGGNVVISSAAPGLFTVTQNGAGQAAALNQDNTINGPTNPAPAGSTVQLYGTGQGQVSPAVPDGTAAPLDTLSNTVAVPTSDSNACLNSQPSVCVAFGTTLGNIQYSGLAPGYIGLWQINVTIPRNISPGNVTMRVIINGAPSNQVTIAVK